MQLAQNCALGPTPEDSRDRIDGLNRPVGGYRTGVTIKVHTKGENRVRDMSQEIRVHTSSPDDSAGTQNMTLCCLYRCTARDVCVDLCG